MHFCIFLSPRRNTVPDRYLVSGGSISIEPLGILIQFIHWVAHKIDSFVWFLTCDGTFVPNYIPLETCEINSFITEFPALDMLVFKVGDLFSVVLHKIVPKFYVDF